MRVARFVTALLAATAWAVGMPVAPEGHSTPATPTAVTSFTDTAQWVRSTSHDPRASPEHTAHLCLSPAPRTMAAGPPSALPMCGPDGTAGTLAKASQKCTVHARTKSQVNAARPGDIVCLAGNDFAGTQLIVTASGTDRLPVTITGIGNTTVRGIRVYADDVIIQDLAVIDADAPGVQLAGNHLTLRNTMIDHPIGGDFDGIRFFGDGIRILHNRIMNITNTGGAHADCMQTFATTTPTSHDVLISGNRCEKIDNQCLIVQGPHSRAGNGSENGESSGLTFSNNYCDSHASQAVHVDDVQNTTMAGNDIQGEVRQAFNFVNGSTGAKTGCNRLGPGVDNEVSMDESSQPGYQRT